MNLPEQLEDSAEDFRHAEENLSAAMDASGDRAARIAWLYFGAAVCRLIRIGLRHEAGILKAKEAEPDARTIHDDDMK